MAAATMKPQSFRFSVQTLESHRPIQLGERSRGAAEAFRTYPSNTAFVGPRRLKPAARAEAFRSHPNDKAFVGPR